jgi:hypothetical protein
MSDPLQELMQMLQGSQGGSLPGLESLTPSPDVPPIRGHGDILDQNAQPMGPNQMLRDRFNGPRRSRDYQQYHRGVLENSQQRALADALLNWGQQKQMLGPYDDTAVGDKFGFGKMLDDGSDYGIFKKPPGNEMPVQPWAGREFAPNILQYRPGWDI